MRTASEEHFMARTSAKYVVERHGPLTLAEVMRKTGLCEIRAKKALEDLVASNVLIKKDWKYDVRIRQSHH
jgi:hypothetical protein